MRMMTSMLALAALGMAAPMAQVQAQTAAASPELTARIDGVVGEESEELRIASLDIRVERRGGIAQTTMLVRFDNPTDMTLEGQFGLTLPAGSVVTGYALDVEGAMIDGVLQSRDRAREAFERRVVRRIDPGLAEVDFSDRFETRVYPIFPRQGRTVRIEFISPLEADGRYALPLQTGEIGNVSLRVDGVEQEPGGGFGWRREGSAWVVAANDRELDGTLEFTLAASDGVTVSDHPGVGSFFELSGVAAPADRRDTRSEPLTILWDRSVSRLDDMLEREADVARELTERVADESASLVLFDSGGTETVGSLSPREMERRLAGGVRYAGATDYGVLAGLLENIEGTCVIFTDGRATLGDRPDLTGAGCRLLLVSSSPEADRPWLEAQAGASGGAFVDLSANDDISDTLAQLLAAPRAPVVTDSAGTAVATRALPAPDGRYRLVGPVPADGALRVNGTDVAMPSRVAPSFEGPGALWAAQHLAVVRDTMRIEDLAAEARRYSVATPGVSFIVLETPEDYVDSGFVPPDSYPKDLRERYDVVQRMFAEQSAERDQQHYAQIVRQWEQRQAWWAGRAAAEDDSPSIVAIEQRVPRPPVAPPPPAPPPPPPPPPPPAPEAQNIVVTGARVRSDTMDSPAAVTMMDMEESAMEASSDGDAGFVAGGAPVATLAEWDANRPYIDRWDEAGDNWPAAVTDTEQEHGSLPLFYLDLAEWHWNAGRAQEARRAAEAALELPTRDNVTLSIVAARLVRYGDPARAIWLLEQLVDREAARPHPLMELAEAHRARARLGGEGVDARADLARALELYIEAGLNRWPDEYRRVNEFALAEANAVIVELGGPDAPEVVLDPKFIDPMPLDVRVVAFWNRPRTDMDLWVTEPDGTEIGFSNRSSASGGRYLHDITQGYGPEEYALRRAPDGTYRIELNTYSVDRRDPNGPTTVTVRLIRDFATANQREELIDVEARLDSSGRRLVGTIAVD